ncbi:MAG: aliphatic sulfonate ABC transporter substrate-binding protein [Chloroflexota bacterium]
MNQALARRTARRSLLAGIAGTAMSGLALRLPRRAAAEGGEVRIGYQKGSGILLQLKADESLNQKFADIGYTVTWTEFTSGPPLLEAMNAGSIDVGTTGAPPPIFAQSAGADLVYTLATAPSPTTQGIIVPKDSPIQTAADLKGRKVAVAKGSSAHALLVRALQFGDLAWGDAEPVYLQPADAKAAFEGGSVEAWSIWDPYYAAEELESGARTLLTDETVGAPNRSFYLASRAFATDHTAALDLFNVAITEADAWVDAHPEEVAKSIAEQTGLPEEVTLKVENRRLYGIEPITPEVIADQQALADLFHELAIIPEKIDIAAAVLAP